MADLEVRPGLTIPDDELTFSTARSGGPGGQHVNKTSSKVIVRFGIDDSSALTQQQKTRLKEKLPPRYLTKENEVLVSSERYRDQHRNREDVVDKLAEVLREALKRPKKRIPTKPSKAARQRRRKEKEAQSKKKRERGRKDFD